ncbi:DUF1127 domain-containing protein [Rubellimicrobium arenae]|uniref:DUF1127 domain-containing protein n=1 Tax=Rubellimicrobium arenae TaxID=2817372 RepID=UPI001B315A37|nr:DUF1127 domain-containing protein [Rubellimicrobium arenae]
MAYTTQDTRSLSAGSVRTSVGGLRAEFARRLAQYRLYRQTVSELASLTDRDLADLGIHRSRIQEIAAQAAARA